MPRAGFILAAALAASPAFAQVPAPPAGQPAPVNPQSGGGAHIPTPGSGAPIAATPGAPSLTAAPGAPLDPLLAAHLAQWETVMQGATTFYTECTQRVENKVTRKTSEFTGSIMCMKPNLARMRLDKKPAPGVKPSPNDYTAFICTGQSVYEYDATEKRVTEYKLRNGGVGDNLLLEFISGALKAKDVVERFDLKLLQPTDPNYVFLAIKPRQARDKAEFETMILVLFKPNLPKAPEQGYLPRTVVIRKNNGQEEQTWDFPLPRINVKDKDGRDAIRAEFFRPEQWPRDWKFQTAQQPSAGAPGTPTGQPRVARPMGP